MRDADSCKLFWYAKHGLVAPATMAPKTWPLLAVMATHDGARVDHNASYLQLWVVNTKLESQPEAHNHARHDD